MANHNQRRSGHTGGLVHHHDRIDVHRMDDPGVWASPGAMRTTCQEWWEGSDAANAANAANAAKADPITLCDDTVAWMEQHAGQRVVGRLDDARSNDGWLTTVISPTIWAAGHQAVGFD